MGFHEADIPAAAERPACTRQYHNFDSVIFFCLFQCSFQFQRQVHVQCIQGRRIIQRDNRYRIFHNKTQHFKIHGNASCNIIVRVNCIRFIITYICSKAEMLDRSSCRDYGLSPSTLNTSSCKTFTAPSRA